MTSGFLAGFREITGMNQEDVRDEQILYQALREGIAKLQNESGEKLFQILYRLDVSESKVQAVFKNCMPENWPEELAKLILEREKERLKWRAKYMEDKDSNPSGENQPEQR